MAALNASSPMKKSKSSKPRLELKKELAEVEDLAPLLAAVDVAIAVGKTYEGESFPANPNLVNPVPLSMTTAGVPIDDMMMVLDGTIGW